MTVAIVLYSHSKIEINNGIWTDLQRFYLLLEQLLKNCKRYIDPSASIHIHLDV